jgi:hypothetical protein
MWQAIKTFAGTVLGTASSTGATAGTISKYLKANPWVGDVASYAIQRRDTNRAHRRQMNDLNKAGINPILSAKLGGAATPSMAGMGQTMNTARQIDQTEKLTDSQIEKIDQEIENLIASEDLSYTQSANIREATEKLVQEGIGLVYDNVYKHIIANHQQKNPNMTIANYYGTTVAKITDSILKGKRKKK